VIIEPWKQLVQKFRVCHCSLTGFKHPHQTVSPQHLPINLYLLQIPLALLFLTYHGQSSTGLARFK
jgi:hypothetical protein